MLHTAWAHALSLGTREVQGSNHSKGENFSMKINSKHSTARFGVRRSSDNKQCYSIECILELNENENKLLVNPAVVAWR